MSALQTWLHMCCSTDGKALPKPRSSPQLTVRGSFGAHLPLYPEVLSNSDSERSKLPLDELADNCPVPTITLVPPGENASPQLLFVEGVLAVKEDKPQPEKKATTKRRNSTPPYSRVM